MGTKLHAADLFCGAGGTSIGAELSGAARVRFAVNHWDVAVQTHSANFPHARHVNSRLDLVRPSECPKIDLLFASPECIHHSRARGGRPTSDQQRAGAWELLPWIEHHRPSFVVVENVTEFQEWGPVGDNGRPLKKFRGKFFAAWLMAIEAAGYRVEVCRLNAADFGAATSRERLFVICRKGNRMPRVPEPTHAKNPGVALPGMQRLPWRPAMEVIDWSIPCPSIFTRKRPLADKTLLRIDAGLRRFVGAFVSRFNGGADFDRRNYPTDQPLSVIDTSNRFGVAVPLVMSTLGGGVARETFQPVPTITASGGATLTVPYVVPFLGEREGQAPRVHGSDGPLPTITTSNPKANSVPYLSSYYGNGDSTSLKSPVPTIVTKDRHALIVATIDPSCLAWPEPHSDAMAQLQATMRELGVADIGFRMLANHELAAAQGFPEDYIFTGNKSQVTKQIGNSVSPPVAKAITESLVA